MKKISRKVFVMMSGGIDSSAAAFLLKKAGYDVMGVTFDLALTGAKCVSLKNLKSASCCGIGSLADAKFAASQIGIKHRVLNFKKAFKENIIKPFIESYNRGITPNPCVWCNQYVKFDRFLKWAKKEGADYVATGHYARKREIKNQKSKIKNSIQNSKIKIVYKLYQAKDKKKDQSYFLWTLKQNQLRHCLFPIGDYLKSEIRIVAKKAGLYVASKEESQDICFAPSGKYYNLFGQKYKSKIREGNIIDRAGNILGKHRGIVFYTIGQRRGLNISGQKPCYVIKIDAKNNAIVVGEREECFTDEFLAKDLSWVSARPENKSKVFVKIRSQQRLNRAKIIFEKKGFLRVKMQKRIWAPAPGQSAVFYSAKKELFGGGIIS